MSTEILGVLLNDQVHGCFDNVVTGNMEMELGRVFSLSAEKRLHEEHFRVEVPVDLLVNMEHLSLHVGIQNPVERADIEPIAVGDWHPIAHLDL